MATEEHFTATVQIKRITKELSAPTQVFRGREVVKEPGEVRARGVEDGESFVVRAGTMKALAAKIKARAALLESEAES